jgi:hypothetical protein
MAVGNWQMGIFNREIHEPRENFKTLNTLADAGREAVGAGWDLTTMARREADGRWKLDAGACFQNRFARFYFY